MKRVMKTCMSLALSIAIGCLAACGGTMQPLPKLPTLQQQFVALCPIVTADLLNLSTSPVLLPDQQKLALKAHDFNVKACTAGSSLNLTDLKDFANTSLPLLATAIAAIPPTPAFPSGLISIALSTFGPLALQVVEQQIVASAPTSAPAASAPTAASASR